MSDFSIRIIENIRKSLVNESAGNSRCTMTDLDLAVSMLSELIELKRITSKPVCCLASRNIALEEAATMADELGTWGHENGCPHTEADGYRLGARIRTLITL
jgi:hypothetical protein